MPSSHSSVLEALGPLLFLGAFVLGAVFFLGLAGSLLFLGYFILDVTLLFFGPMVLLGPCKSRWPVQLALRRDRLNKRMEDECRDVSADELHSKGPSCRVLMSMVYDSLHASQRRRSYHMCSIAYSVPSSWLTSSRRTGSSDEAVQSTTEAQRNARRVVLLLSQIETNQYHR